MHCGGEYGATAPDCPITDWAFSQESRNRLKKGHIQDHPAIVGAERWVEGQKEREKAVQVRGVLGAWVCLRGVLGIL